MTYKWEILKLNVIPSLDGLQNIIKSVNWRFMVRDDMFYGDVYDVTELEYPKTQSFIKYDDLTEETIVGWVKKNINYDELVSKATQLLEQNKNPSVLEKDPPFVTEQKYTGEEEYLIIIDGDPEKHWGPLKWNTERANNGLIHYGITDYKFPFNITMYQKELLPIDAPFVVNDRITVYRVEYTEKPETYDKLTEYTGDLTWVFDSGKAVGTYFIHQRTVNKIKELLFEKTLRKFLGRYNENSLEVEVDGVKYNINSSLDSRAILFMAKATLGDSDSTIIRLPGSNEYIEITQSSLDLISQAVHNHYMGIIAEEKQIMDSIKNSNTIEELKEIEV